MKEYIFPPEDIRDFVTDTDDQEEIFYTDESEQ